MRTIFLFSILLGLLCIGCNRQPISGPNTLHLPISNDPPTLDPRKAGDTTSCDILNMCFEGLTRMGHGHEVKPGIASSIQISDDGLVYTFQLRECYWTDGSPITAYDFEETWKEILSPKFPSNNAYLLYPILNAKEAKEGDVDVSEVGVTALSAQTLQVKLWHPAPYFLELTSQPIFMAYPKRIAMINASYKKPVICSGPFKMSQYRFGNFMRLERNEHYWEKEVVKISDITIHVIQDQATALNLYEQRSLNWAGRPFRDLPTDAIPALLNRTDFHFGTTLGVYFYIFNTKKFPFNNAKIRKALSLAINRDDIVEHITHGGHTPAFALSPPPFTSIKGESSQSESEVLARKLFNEGLKELGITPSQFPKIELTYNTNGAHHQIAQAIQQHWYETLGVRVGLRNREWKVYLDELNGRQFDVARMGEVASFSDPIAFLENFTLHKGYANHSGWFNQAFTQKINSAKIEADSHLRKQYVKDAEITLMEEMPVAPIYYYSLNYLKDPALKNVYTSQLGSVDFKWAYFDRSSQQ